MHCYTSAPSPVIRPTTLKGKCNRTVRPDRLHLKSLPRSLSHYSLDNRHSIVHTTTIKCDALRCAFVSRKSCTLVLFFVSLWVFLRALYSDTQIKCRALQSKQGVISDTAIQQFQDALKPFHTNSTPPQMFCLIRPPVVST